MMRSHKMLTTLGTALLILAVGSSVLAGDIAGTIVDANWYARRTTSSGLDQSNGVGVYEYGAFANGQGLTSVGGSAGTAIYGNFTMAGLTAGTYTLAAWDVWSRSEYVFNQILPASGMIFPYIHLHANVWGYACIWDQSYHTEFGQTFAASGSSVVMLYFRVASVGDGEVTIHAGGPGGPQIGPKKTFHSSGGPADIRLFYNGGDVPTVPGDVYYVKIRFTTPGGGSLLNMHPIPDYSDPMPEGCLYQDGVADPRRDLGVVIYSDDDGIVTNSYIVKNAAPTNTTYAMSSMGQTLLARGTSLISAAVWIPDTASTYVFKVFDHPGGTQIGPTKKNKVARGGDPEIMALWQPGEVPLTPGSPYYLEVTRDGGGAFQAMVSYSNPYANGNGYIDGVQQSTMDLISTTMEEEYPGSAAMPAVTFKSFPNVVEGALKPTSFVVLWTTDVASDSLVEWAEGPGSYTDSVYSASQSTVHSITVNGLKPNTLYHFRATSKKAGYKSVRSRDMVICTKNDSANLLVNPSFEEGTGTSPRWPVPGWIGLGLGAGLDIKVQNGNWFGTPPIHEGNWSLEGAKNGGPAEGMIYQRVSATPGMKYDFSTWVYTQPHEDIGAPDHIKNDVWNNKDRLIYMRIGIDPYGGTDPRSTAIQWTPYMYSHLRYTNIATSAVAASDHITVFVHMTGGPNESWYIYAVDDCVLTSESSETDLAKIKGNVPSDTSVNFTGGVVTAIPSQAGAYYVEMPDRSCGIRVESTSTVSEGTVVAVQGGLVTLPTRERAITNATLTTVAADTTPGPLEMQCQNVGGYAFGPQIPAVPGSQGLHNTGLLIKLAGTVTQKATDSSYIFINDGSLPGDGVKVDTSKLSAAKVPDVGSVVSVVGISTLWNDGSTVRPMLQARRDADMSEKLN